MSRKFDLSQERLRLEAMKSFENECEGLVAGVDEVGRGPLAGPVVVAACILDKAIEILGINDSKKLSEKKREIIYEEIVKKAIDYNIVYIYEKDIDEMNILEATRLAMKQAVLGLSVKPDFVLSDAVHIEGIDISQTNIIKGDEKSVSIAAASILAKVSRDRYMIELSKKYPDYSWDKNKGYGTKAHIDGIKAVGLCKHHRKSFCKKYE